MWHWELPQSSVASKNSMFETLAEWFRNVESRRCISHTFFLIIIVPCRVCQFQDKSFIFNYCGFGQSLKSSGRGVPTCSNICGMKLKATSTECGGFHKQDLLPLLYGATGICWARKTRDDGWLLISSRWAEDDKIRPLYWPSCGESRWSVNNYIIWRQMFASTL